MGLGSRLKVSLYALYSKLLSNHYVSNQILYALLLLVELVQFVYYPLTKLRPDYDVLTTSLSKSVYPYIFYALAGCLGVYFAIFVALFSLSYCATRSHGLQPGHVDLGGKTSQSAAEWKESFKFCFRLYGFMLSIYQHVLFLPAIWACVLVIKPDNLKEIAGEAAGQAGFVAGAVLLLAIGSALAMVTAFFFHDEEVDAEQPWSMLPLVAEYVKLAKKVVVGVALCFRESNDFETGVLVVLCLAGAVEILTIIRNLPLTNRLANFAFSVAEVGAFAYSFFALVNCLLDSYLVDYFSFFISLLPTAVIVITLVKRQQQTKTLSAASIQTANSGSEEYVRQMVSLIRDEPNSAAPSPILIGLLRHHCSGCSKADCPCNDIQVGEREKEDVSEGVAKAAICSTVGYEGEIDNGTGTAEQNNRLTGVSKFRRGLYKFLIFAINDAISHTQNEARLHILAARIQLKFLRNKFQAWYDLQEAGESNPSIYDEYCIHRLRYCCR